MRNQLFLARQNPFQLKASRINLGIADRRDQVPVATDHKLTVLLDDVSHQQTSQSQVAFICEGFQACQNLSPARLELLEANHFNLPDAKATFFDSILFEVCGQESFYAWISSQSTAGLKYLTDQRPLSQDLNISPANRPGRDPHP